MGYDCATSRTGYERVDGREGAGEDEDVDDTRPCRNELCDYRLAGGAAYCCAGCATADERGYEVHEGGPLGHSPACARRTSS